MSDFVSYCTLNDEDDTAISASSKEPPQTKNRQYEEDSGGGLGSEDYSSGGEESGGSYDTGSSRSRDSRDSSSTGSDGSYQSGSYKSAGSHDDPYYRSRYRSGKEDLGDDRGSSGEETPYSGDEASNIGGESDDNGSRRSDRTGADSHSQSRSDCAVDDKATNTHQSADFEGTGDVGSSNSDSNEESSQIDDNEDEEFDGEQAIDDENGDDQTPSPAKSEGSDIVHSDETSGGLKREARDIDEPTQASTGMIESKDFSYGEDASDSDDVSTVVRRKEKDGESESLSSGGETRDRDNDNDVPSQAQGGIESKAASSVEDINCEEFTSSKKREEELSSVTHKSENDWKADFDLESQSTGVFSKARGSEEGDGETIGVVEVKERSNSIEAPGPGMKTGEDNTAQNELDKECQSGASQCTGSKKQASTEESAAGDTRKVGRPKNVFQDGGKAVEPESGGQERTGEFKPKKNGAKNDKEDFLEEESSRFDSEEDISARKEKANGSSMGGSNGSGGNADVVEESVGVSSDYEADSDEEGSRMKLKANATWKATFKMGKSEYEAVPEVEPSAENGKAAGCNKVAAKKSAKTTNEVESLEDQSGHKSDSEEEISIEESKGPNDAAKKSIGNSHKEHESKEQISSEYGTYPDEGMSAKKAKGKSRNQADVKKAKGKKGKTSLGHGDKSAFESTSERMKSDSSSSSIAIESKKKKNSTSRRIADDDSSRPPMKIKASYFTGRRSRPFSKFYDLGDFIGKGAFASVFSARSKETGTMRAVKKIKKSDENKSRIQLLVNEFELLKGLDHPNLIKLHELFEDDESYFLVTDLCKGGTLQDEIIKSRVYPEKYAAVFFRQLLACVNYIHGREIVHRDLKPGNILLENTGTVQIRIINFGTACRCGKYDKLSEPMGTPAYMAPEVLGMSYGRKSDLWSCGVILFLILSGQQPFKGKTTEETFTNIVTGEFSFADPAWKTISEEAKDLIKNLLKWEESLRVTSAQALEHSWVANNCSFGSSSEDSIQNWGKFDAHSQLRLATQNFIASVLLSRSQKSKIDEVFLAIDADSDGKLTKEESRIGYERVIGRDLNDEEIDQIFEEVAKDGTGALEYVDFVFGVMSAMELFSKENLSEVFQAFDRDGFITMQKLKDLLKFDLALEKKAVKQIMSEVNKDGDNLISFDDFLFLAAVPNPERTPAAAEKRQAACQQEVKQDDPDSDSTLSTPARSESFKDIKSQATSLVSLLNASDQMESKMEGIDFEQGSQESLSIKLSAAQFISHRLGQLTDHYEIVDYIAKGSYGVVCSALHKETGATRAIKELKKSKKNKAKNGLLLKEFRILKSLDHPNILQMHELFEDKSHYYLVTGVSRGGDLHREIKQQGSLKEEDAAALLNQLLICVNYCHKNNIVHRDLKPGNILLEEHKKLNHIKIIDFGEAVVSEPSAKLTEVAGTMAYMAPEVLGMSYGHKCDIWSCGVIAYLALTGKQPLRGASDEETFNNIVEGKISYEDPIWHELSRDAQDFVKQLLSWEESLRPTAEEALEHPWLLKMLSRKSSSEFRTSTMTALSNIKDFNAQSKLRVATCAFIASQLMDKAEKEKIDDVFRAIDLNHDGTLNRKEVKQGYEKYFGRELCAEEVNAIFRHVDADGTGELEYSEFLFGALDQQNLLSSENLKKAFSIFDTCGDGHIGFLDLKLLLRDSLTHDETTDEKALNKLIAQVDLDGDGKISYEEFVKMALGAPSVEATSPKKDTEKQNDIWMVGNGCAESFKDEKSVTFSDLHELRDSNSVECSSRHLQKAIARASQQRNNSHSSRDPPIQRRGPGDPPSEEERRVSWRNPTTRACDPEPSKLSPTNWGTTNKSQEISSFPVPAAAADSQLLPYCETLTTKIVSQIPTGAQSHRQRLSPQDAKIEEACQGFERVQENIARLRTLLTTNMSAKPNLYSNFQRGRDRKRPPHMETLDSAFAKLSQMQSKMRALQALVKSNQIEQLPSYSYTKG